MYHHIRLSTEIHLRVFTLQSEAHRYSGAVGEDYCSGFRLRFLV